MTSNQPPAPEPTNTNTTPPVGAVTTIPIPPVGGSALSPPSPRTPRLWGRAVDRIARSVRRRRPEEGVEETIQTPVEPTVRVEEELEAPPSATAAPGRTAAEAESQGDGAIPPAPPRDRTRNYLIWVIGGYYPETHPILTSPHILLNQFDQDDLWGLADLLGQVKPPVATKQDIEKAGLEVIKASSIAQYSQENKITSNCSDRCLICLSEYEPDEDVRIMSCKHAFHQPCVDKWLEVGKNNCPACRTKGVEVSDTQSSLFPPSTEAGSSSTMPTDN